MGFRSAVLLLPVLSLLHVLEEWPRFPRWARRFASDRYTDREYVIVHAVSIAIAGATGVLLSWFPARWLSFALVALVIGPATFWNSLFHLGATLVTRSYCAGVLTGIALYLPFSAALARQALREGVISPALLAVALLLALAFHVLEVGHSVFKRW